MVTASEIAAFVYCPEAWRLEHGLGLEAGNREALEPFVPPSAAPSRPVNTGLGDLVLIATCLYSAVW